MIDELIKERKVAFNNICCSCQLLVISLKILFTLTSLNSNSKFEKNTSIFEGKSNLSLEILNYKNLKLTLLVIQK